MSVNSNHHGNAFLALGRSRLQGVDENYLVRYHPCTEVAQGWPWSFRTCYPQGNVNPGEWLAWDIDPIFQQSSNVGFCADALIFLMILSVGAMLTVFIRSPLAEEWAGGLTVSASRQ